MSKQEKAVAAQADKQKSPVAGRKLDVIVATDCGSTTTKAIMIERKQEGYRQTFRGEAPTTVEAPFEDVTKGVLNAVQELEELSGRQIIDWDAVNDPQRDPTKLPFITPTQGENGVDIYISTSSAGGGLQMMVAGLVKTMTAESAERAALGGGAIVMDVLAINDGRLPHERIERIRRLRPDMILLAGGIDSDEAALNKKVAEMAELIAAADPKPRLGHSYQLPLIYSGNKYASEAVTIALSQRDKDGEPIRSAGGGYESKVAYSEVANIRPTLEHENLAPARAKIQDLFEEHVMAQAPGYDKLLKWVDAPVMPTPAAMGYIIATIAEVNQMNVIGVDIGGATTDVFSSFDVHDERLFNRSVSANLGMSYSVSNVMAEAGWENVMRWVPFDVDEEFLRDQIKNKMIRPTTIPQSLASLVIEQALAREALRLAFEQHKLLATGLKGVQRVKSLDEAFAEDDSGGTFIKMMELNLLVGSGGVLSHAPRRNQSMHMLIDAFLPEGFTALGVDSIFMMPHLGVLAQVDADAAEQVFDRDCMIYLGSVLAPAGQARRFGDPVCEYNITFPDGKTESGTLKYGELKLFPNLKVGEEAMVEANPTRAFNVGDGNGKPLTRRMNGGVVGLVLDGRGRPLGLNEDAAARRKQLMEWGAIMNSYADLSKASL
ncbi:glutamate mutase L [bacterium]|nr:glutamate mutase L [bacterium]